MNSGGVLGSQKILERIHEIFVTESATADNVREASYDLRLADDGLLFGGRWHGIGQQVVGDVMIRRGEVAVLSTAERFRMPSDLVGNVNVKFKQALKGLILLFGSRVDPKYGWDLRSPGVLPTDPYNGQRLYLLVCNIGSQDVTLRPGDSVFMVEFYVVDGSVTTRPRQNNDSYIAERFSEIGKFGFLLGIDQDVARIRKESRFQRQVTRIFLWGFLGVLLVTILGEALSFWLSLGPGIRAKWNREEAPAGEPYGGMRIVGVVKSVQREKLFIRPSQAVHRLASGMLLLLQRVDATGDMQYVATLRVSEVVADGVVASVLSRVLVPQVGDIAVPGVGDLR